MSPKIANEITILKSAASNKWANYHIKTTATKQCYHTSTWNRATSLTHPTTMRHFARLNFTCYVVFFFACKVNCILFLLHFSRVSSDISLPAIYSNCRLFLQIVILLFSSVTTLKKYFKLATLWSCRHSLSCWGALQRATGPFLNLIWHCHKTFLLCHLAHAIASRHSAQHTQSDRKWSKNINYAHNFTVLFFCFARRTRIWFIE